MFELCTLSSAFHVQALVSWALGTLHCFSDQLNGTLPGSLACIPFSLRADQYFALLNFVRAVRGVQNVFQGVDRFASCNASCPLCLTTNYGLKRLLLLLHLRGKTSVFSNLGPIPCQVQLEETNIALVTTSTRTSPMLGPPPLCTNVHQARLWQRSPRDKVTHSQNR